MRVCCFLSLWLTLAFARGAEPGYSGRPFLELGPMLGHVSSTNAHIWAKASRPARLSVRISVNPDLSRSRTVKGPKLNEASAFMGSVPVDKLEAGRRYFYCVQLDGRSVMNRPYPSFITAPLEGTPGRVRFGFTSCVGGRGYHATAGYADMAARTNFDLLLMLGDNHYANSTDPAKQRLFYAEQRLQPGWAELTGGRATYAIWDDHDYGPNNSDGTLAGKDIALRTFREHWANPGYGEPENPGAYCKFTRGNVDFFLLDVRYYRTPNRATNAPGRTMLGKRQKEWLKRELLASRAPVKVVASGSEFQTDGTADSWANFKTERDELLRHIADHDITGVLVVSGDRHFVAGYQAGGKVIEVTAGPLGSGNSNAKIVPEMFLTFSPTKSKFYCVYDIDTEPSPPRVTLEVYRVAEGMAHRREFKWDEILGRTKIPLLDLGATNAPAPRAARR